MGSENKFWATFWGIMMAGLCVVIIATYTWSYYRDKAFMEKGYTRQTLQGSACVEWVKDKVDD